ncbi:MAG TPA: NAD(P)-dependent oxidoreductase [Solirubrobacterales bacterium]|jgi:nucleoside-diphosphate-sugar epimerase|nr:NAD(P)-dependent oxidoreductase [Solirubrobacterales bacterium]
MKVFVAGAGGALGKQLVPRLVADGHEVVGMIRSESKREAVRALGAQPVVADALDRDAALRVVGEAQPEAILHELTAIPPDLQPKHFDRDFALTNRLRSEGTDNLLAAARAAGTRRLIAQSFTGWPYARRGGPVKTEEDPLDPEPPAQFRRTLEVIRQLEDSVAGAADVEGLVLRYGGFYGPGTSIGVNPDGAVIETIRKRGFPVVGGGAGVWSFVQIADAAVATVAALERGAPGIYNVVDDDPAPVSEWLPALAEALGAKPPRRVPRWLGRLVAGDAAVAMMTEQRGASNAKAKRELGWQLRYPSWRDGFREGLG